MVRQAKALLDQHPEGKKSEPFRRVRNLDAKTSWMCAYFLLERGGHFCRKQK